ncbi:hypothetical protein FQZ44_08335, partial [Campylobacter jejuni]|nr:hypothetical protein [Campylobacter jejuni]
MNLNKIIVYLKNNYYVLYFIGFAVIFTGFKINKFICIIGFILILILGFLDLYQVIKRVNFAKIYNLLIFFGLYYIAEFFSRHIIYTTVNYMPD